MAGNGRNQPVFKSAFRAPEDEFNPNLGIRPVVFDILGPDRETSILPEGVRMVLHVNPQSMSFSYAKVIERIQTKGGFVEQHWGEGARAIDFSGVTGGFKRLYSGLSNVTGGGYDTGGTRRDTIAYDKYLDLLALFHNNGSVYDNTGEIAFQGIIKMSFDGGVYYGWFQNFNVNESAERPYLFELTTTFTVSHEALCLRSMPWASGAPTRLASVTLQGSQATATIQGQTVEGFGKDITEFFTAPTDTRGRT